MAPCSLALGDSGSAASVGRGARSRWGKNAALGEAGGQTAAGLCVPGLPVGERNTSWDTNQPRKQERVRKGTDVGRRGASTCWRGTGADALSRKAPCAWRAVLLTPAAPSPSRTPPKQMKQTRPSAESLERQRRFRDSVDQIQNRSSPAIKALWYIIIVSTS